jgi:acyl-CoA hydrolase
MTGIVLPGDTNVRGTVFGGRILEMIDKAAAIASVRHCRTGAVTASIDHVDFRSPVRMGDIVHVEAVVNQAFRSSMEVGVKVYSEEPTTGARRHTTSAFVTMVAVGDDGRPLRVPRLEPQTPRERLRARGAERRRRVRLKLRRRGGSTRESGS